MYIPSPGVPLLLSKGRFVLPLLPFQHLAALQVLRTRLANIQRRILRPLWPFGNDWNDSFFHLFPTRIDNIIRQHKPADGPLVLCPWTCRVCNFFSIYLLEHPVAKQTGFC